MAKDLGLVTAYGYAQAGGYTGTEAEFEMMLANAGRGIVSVELTSTVGYVKTYTITFTDGTTTTFEVTDGEVTDESLEETLESYAKINGYYDELTSGSAEQLLSTQFVEDSVPYNFRTSGGSKDIGDREYDEIVGGTIAWNQLAKASISSATTISGVTITPNADGSVTLNGTASSSGVLSVFSAFPTIAGHKYLLRATGSGVTQGATGFTSIGGSSGFKESIRIASSSISSSANCTLRSREGVTYTNGKVWLNCFDLTQMFGSTIADHIYSLEQAEAGKGVEWFKALFPKDYYEYNAGELISVNALRHDTVGFNAFDKDDTTDWKNFALTTGKIVIESSAFGSAIIKCVPNATYYACKTKGARIGLASFPNYPVAGDVATEADWSNTGLATQITTGANDRYLLVWFYNGNVDSSIGVTAIAETLNVNLSWSGYRNGEYEPYEKHSYALDDSLELRGIPKLDASNNLYYDGDTYKYDGSVTRNTILRAYQSGDESLANAITDGTNTVVYSANASTETADPYDEIQLVDDFGTEEYIDNRAVAVPVGHNTKYPANLRDKLQHLPNMADSDGAYLIRQTNKQMTLDLFRIPKAPTTDGDYTLKAHVSGGTPTYTWEAES